MACSTLLPREAAHVVRFEPQADMAVVHHMLLYLCPGEPLVRPGIFSQGHPRSSGRAVCLCACGRLRSWAYVVPPTQRCHRRLDSSK